jgi:hypothetical protein
VVRPNLRMQSTGRRGAELRSGGALLDRHYGSEGLCGRGHEGPQLMRKSLGSTYESLQWSARDMADRPLLRSVLPRLAAELQRGLSDKGHPELAVQVDSLHVVDRCRCGDSFCATFYNVPPPKGAWGPGHETIPLDSVAAGIVNVDVLNGRIVAVEVLFQHDTREALQKACP